MSWKMLKLRGTDEFKVPAMIPLKAALADIEEMEYIVSVAFGPEGRGVLCTKMGNVTISRGGYDILGKVYERKESPLRDVILDCAKKVDQHLGDGVKTFIILLASLLRNFSTLRDTSRACRQLKLLRFQLPCHEICGTAQGDLTRVATTFFSTRFHRPIHEFLSKLFNEWVESNSAVCDDIYTHLSDNFDALITDEQESKPLFDSRVSKGIWLKGEFMGSFDLNLKKCVLKVLNFTQGENEEDIVSAIVHFSNDVSHTLEETVLLVTNSCLPDEAKFFLRLKNIQTMHRVSSEIVFYLQEFSNIHLARHKSDLRAEFYRSTIQHKTTVHLLIDVFQLVVCSPLPSLTTLYFDSIKNCLQLCKVAAREKSPIVECGKFEKLFSTYFALSFGSRDCIPISGREELIEWENTKSQILGKLQHLSLEPSKDTGENCLESMVIKFIVDLKRSSLSLDCDVVKHFCDSLMCVARKLPSMTEVECFEPLILKLTILEYALDALLIVLNINGILNCKRYPK